MNLYAKSVLCIVALFLATARISQAADRDSLASDDQLEFDSVTSASYESASPACGVPLSVYVPNANPGFNLHAGFLLLKPGADNLGYATITTFLPLGNPQWAVETLNPDNQPGFTVGASWDLASPGIDVQTSWEHLRTSDAESVAVDNLATQWVSPFNQTGPSTSESPNEVGIFHLKSAAAQVEFDYDMANIDMGQTVNIGANAQLRLFAGVSIVRLREQLVSTFYNNPNVVPVPPVIAIPDATLQSISLDNTSTYTGAGPRLGLNTSFNLSHGFTFVSQLSGAILQGRMQPAQYSFTAVFDDVINAEQIKSGSVTQVVYASDAKVGLGYSRLLRNGSVLELETGFKAAVFMDPFATYETSTNVLPLDIGSLSTNSMRHTPSDFTLGGFYASGGLRW